MAYRFNPPPNWPIEDDNWTPPPGWQPDPSWGPAPEGWNFWVQEDAAPATAETADTGTAEAAETVVVPASDAPEGQQKVDADAAPDAPDAQVPHVDTSEPAVAQDEAFSAQEPAAAAVTDQAATVDDDATRVVSAKQYEPIEDSAQTQEYTGPDLAADHATPAPYEHSEWVAPQTDAQAPQTDHSSAQAVGWGGAAAGAYGAQDQSAVPAQSSAGYGQGSANTGYGQGSANAGYGQDPAATGYGQGSANTGYGQGSANAWAPTADGSEPPKKSLLARFWWVGCVCLVLALGAIIGLISLFAFLGRETASPEPPKPTPTPSPTVTDPSDEGGTDSTPEPSDGSSDEPATIDPSTLPALGPNPKTIEVVAREGKGTLKISQEWKKSTEIEGEHGPIEPATKNGDHYLVVTAEMTVKEGKMALQPFQLKVTTPYGGDVKPGLATFQQKNAGVGIKAPEELTAGQTYSIRVLLDVQSAGGLTLVYDNFSNSYKLPVQPK